jgi:putative ABC transport system permease protein
VTASSPTVALVLVCVAMVVVAAVVQRVTGLGGTFTVPVAAGRAVAQLAAISAVLVVAMARLWSSILVLAVMFVVAWLTAARRSQATAGRAWLAVPLAIGLSATVVPLLATGVVPLQGVALVPVVGIVLGGSMTAVAVASRRALDMLALRAGEVDAALSLGMTESDSRSEVMQRALSDALIPNLDQARTAGLVVLPGAFIGVLLSTGSAAQACAVQVVVVIALLLSQTCGVAAVGVLVARGAIVREGRRVE